jgi:hypothetical protein
LRRLLVDLDLEAAADKGKGCRHPANAGPSEVIFGREQVLTVTLPARGTGRRGTRPPAPERAAPW